MVSGAGRGNHSGNQWQAAMAYRLSARRGRGCLCFLGGRERHRVRLTLIGSGDGGSWWQRRWRQRAGCSCGVGRVPANPAPFAQRPRALSTTNASCHAVRAGRADMSLAKVTESGPKLKVLLIRIRVLLIRRAVLMKDNKGTAVTWFTGAEPKPELPRRHDLLRLRARYGNVMLRRRRRPSRWWRSASLRARRIPQQ